MPECEDVQHVLMDENHVSLHLCLLKVLHAFRPQCVLSGSMGIIRKDVNVLHLPVAVHLAMQTIPPTIIL